MKIIVKKGLDIPIAGKPVGSPQPSPRAHQIALNLDPFEDTRFKVLVKVGESVKIGQPLVESKAVAGQMFVSPAGGVVAEIRRGLKRRLLDIIINVDEHETYAEYGKLDLNKATREEILDLFMRSGLFPHIRLRPFNLIPHPKFLPRDIFITAFETRPFLPSFEMQVEGNEGYFEEGLRALTKLTSGKVHLVYSEKSTSPAFTQASGVEKHTATGPHPAGSSSVHIHTIAPIRKPDDYVWSLNALDVVVIGKMVSEGRYFTPRIISIAGTGILEGKREFLLGRVGLPIKELIADRLSNQPLRLISGDPLTGTSVDANDFMSFYASGFSAIPENTTREPFHFFKLGKDKYTATRTYLTGHIQPPKEGFSFTTNQHGEERAFIDGAVYDRVMPMRIPTMHLVKAIICEDFELADQLGLLEVVPEDFALPTFICPSKIEMVSIVKQGLQRYAKEMGH